MAKIPKMEDKKQCCEAKDKKIVSMALDQMAWKAMKTVNSSQGRHELHKIAKQRTLKKVMLVG